MDNFIKALSVSALMSGSFMTHAMDQLEMEASMWGMSVAEYLEYNEQRNGYQQTKEDIKDLETEAKNWGFPSVAEYFDYKEQQNASMQPMFGGDPDLDSTLKLIAQLGCHIEGEQATQNDFLIALALEAVETHQLGAYNLPYLKRKISQEDMLAYKTIVDAAKTIKIDADVHSMTHSFARPHYAKTKTLEQTYLGILQQPNKILTLEEMMDDLEGLAKRNEAIAKIMPSINAVFGLIRGYWKAPVDGETGLDMREVMSNCFILARVYGDAALANLAIILADNTQTGGGCQPGVTGRLAHTFFIEVSAAIGQG